jgi:hypothetical protein
MSTHACQTPIAWATLVDYWSGDLPDELVASTEEQLFACEACGRALDTVVGLSQGIARWGRRGRLVGGSSETVLAQLARDDLQIRRYHLEPGATVHCTIAPEDDVVTAELSADLSHAARVDLVVRQHLPDGVQRTRLEDMSVEHGRVVRWTLPAAALRPLPAHRLDITLIAVEPSGERVVADFRMQHSPWRG